MNGMDNPVFFYPISALIILFAVLSIGFRNIFYSLLSAVIVFFSVGIIFYLLGSEYNAVIQVAIYGLAVPVILGLGIMFTNIRYDESKPSSKMFFAMFFTGGLFAVAAFSIIRLWYEVSEVYLPNPVSTLSAFGTGIYVNYVWAFELVSLILTIAAVGLSLFKRRRECRK